MRISDNIARGLTKPANTFAKFRRFGLLHFITYTGLKALTVILITKFGRTALLAATINMILQ